MSQTPADSSVYYKARYWNDHPLTQAQFDRLVSDSSKANECVYWMDHLKRKYFPDHSAQRAVVINCGNGWAERDLCDRGVISSAICFDYSEELLSDARNQAGGRKLQYLKADCNTVEFPPNSFDLVINVAAMHHVQLIDRMNRLLATALCPEGLFVNFDYVGPHRYLYSKSQLERMRIVNERLPKHLRHPGLVAGHLETMLASDPTEAIHSELVVEMFERYFIPIERKDLGGPIAYQIMHDNPGLLEIGNRVAESYVEGILGVDELCTYVGHIPTFFSFFVGRPRKSILNDQARLSAWTAEELRREEESARHGGRYEI
jgi:SAM-dependent methyltransferase